MPVKAEVSGNTASSTEPKLAYNNMADAKEFSVLSNYNAEGNPCRPQPCRPPVPGNCTQRCRVEITKELK